MPSYVRKNPLFLAMLLACGVTACEQRAEPRTGFSPLGYRVERQAQGDEQPAEAAWAARPASDALDEQAPDPALPLATLQGGTGILAEHFPLFPVGTGATTIVARARNTQHGVDRLSITVTRGSMTDCSENLSMPSAIPCRSGAVTQTKICEFDLAQTEEVGCEFDLTAVGGQLVTYTATAESPIGPATSTIPITFAGTEPAAGTAAPIWWHWPSLPGEPATDRINLGFFPDADYAQDYARFAKHTTDTARYAFFNEDNEFSSTYSQHRHLFDLWAAPWGADAAPAGPDGGALCSRTFSKDLDGVRANLHGSAILHNDSRTDCSSVSASLGGAGSVAATVYEVDWLFVHESAHFVFGLADEYPDGGHSALSEPRNVFDSLSECQAEAPKVSSLPSDCVQLVIGADPKWRIDQGHLETMADREFSSDFRNSSKKAVRNRLLACLQGSCN